MFYYVYILKSIKDGGLYIGYTNNLKRRVEEHINGKVFSTKGRLPITLIYFQGFCSKDDATSSEKYFKTTRGWERIHKMLENSLKRS